MSNYMESKKKLDEIRNKYGCKGDIILRTAIQNVVEYGKCTILDPSWYQCTLDDINAKHDYAEKEGQWLFMSRDFEIAILECMKELSQIDAYYLLTYIQKEVWLGASEVGEPDYQRAIEIIRNCLCVTSDYYGSHMLSCEEILDKFREMELTDDEIGYFGWDFLFDIEEEEENE